MAENLSDFGKIFSIKIFSILSYSFTVLIQSHRPFEKNQPRGKMSKCRQTNLKKKTITEQVVQNNHLNLWLVRARGYNRYITDKDQDDYH